MEYRQIVAVTGLGGLYQLISTKNDGAIVRSLTDKSVKFVSARIHHITPLESIEIYTTGDNVRLHEVLDKIKEKEEGLRSLNLSKADNTAIRSYFKTVLPDFDEDRVYVSDIKKVLKWYDILKANDLLNFEAYLLQAPEEAVAEQSTTEAAEGTEEKPAKKAAPKKKKESAEEAEQVEANEKSAKKAAPKKKKESAEDEESTEKPAKKAAPKKKKAE